MKKAPPTLQKATKRRGRPPLSADIVAKRAAALAKAKAKTAARKRPRPSPVVKTAKKRADQSNAATWRPTYIAERYSLSKSFVKKLYDRGDLPYRKIAGVVLIPAAAAKAFFEGEP